MQRSEVVVRETAGPRRARVGTVLSKTRGSVTVRWDDDGTEETVPQDGRNKFAVRGSLRHQALADVSLVRERFDADPVEVTLQLLRESRSPMSATRIKETFVAWGLDRQAVAAAWTRVQKALRSAENVMAEGKPAKYRWIGPIDEGGEAPAPGTAAGAEVPGSAVPERPVADQPESMAAAVAQAPGISASDSTGVHLLIEGTRRLIDNGSAPVEVLEGIAHSLSRLLPQLPPEMRESVDVAALATIAASLPLRPEGGRAALTAAAARIWPDQMVDARWWSGVSASALAECANGALGAATSLPAVAEQILGPLVRGEFSATTSRRRLALLLGWPTEFLAYVPAETVASAFRRVGTDPLVGEWVAALSQDQRIAEMEQALADAGVEAKTAIERADRAERRASELAARCDHLENVLRQWHAESLSLRAAQQRQLQIDVIRALANLAAEVEELAHAGAGGDDLVDRVRTLVSNYELEPIGSAGAQVPFDPELHAPAFGAPTAGATVAVIRPGYRWRFSDEEVFISKATVSTT